MKLFCKPLSILALLCVILLTGSLTSCISTSKSGYSKATTENIRKVSKDKRLNKALNSWIGTPYRYGGNTKQGVDCSGFVLAIYRDVYGINPKGARSAKQLYHISKKSRLTKLKTGDLVFFRLPKPTDYHVGIYLGENLFVHATTSRGVKVDDLNQPYYKRSYHKGGKLK